MKYVKLGITMAALFMMTLQTKGQNMTLTSKQQALVAIAANEAKGNIEGLKAALNEGLETGLTVSEAKEALSQLYAYTGFPRSLNALGALQQVIKERTEAGLHVEEGREADPLSKDYDALKQGTEVQTQLCGGKPFTYTFAPQTDYYLKAHLFGDIFARNNLTFAEREIVTVSAISALPDCEPQLQAHVSGARCMGVSDETLKAMPALLEQKIGTAEAERLRGALAAVFGESYSPVQTVDSTAWPKGERNPYGKYFTGESYLADVGGGVMNVTFEPRCRNNWHIHHKQVQVLICVAGRGWYQEWGKEAVPMTPGTIIAIPAEVKHWHGAAKDSWFQHLTYHKDVQEGASNEWLETVTDEVYDKLK
ncbi:MAG: carboxymuconolactone decarboxylase family protein [Prevotella sp.]|nr:carboxymuconolactone decarboxylase family protein [Prevotella sp.]